MATHILKIICTKCHAVRPLLQFDTDEWVLDNGTWYHVAPSHKAEARQIVRKIYR